MTILTVTVKGQVTFRKDILHHLGIKPGEKIELNLLPGGRAAVRAARPKGSFQSLTGCLRDKTNGKKLSVEEIGNTIKTAGAEAGTGEA
jgi:bifunctional DNA-binding transcriptional regulator/antitoxin component of YhaV-PrlF toxin-antitoxin module